MLVVLLVSFLSACQSCLAGLTNKMWEQPNCSPFMNKFTVLSSVKIFQKREHGDGIRGFEYSSFHLNVHLLKSLGYFSRYVTIVLLGPLLRALVVRAHYGGGLSIQRLENFQSFWYVTIYVDFVVV